MIGRPSATHGSGFRGCGLLVAALFVLLWPTDSMAQELSRYSVGEEEWNGLSSFGLLARGLGMEVREAPVADLGEFGPGDALVVVYPTVELPVDDLAEWVRDGGRMLLADDFGSSMDMLERLGLSRVPAPVGVGEVMDDNPALPVLGSFGGHSLTEGVGRVVANHPSGLAGPSGALIGWEDGTALLYDMRLGDGHVFVLADPSVLINLMLPLGDNRILARNLLRGLCAGSEPCTVHLVTETDRVVGRPRGVGEVTSWQDVVDALNAWIGRMIGRTPTEQAYRWAALVIVVGALPFLVVLFPMRRQRTLAPPEVPRSRRPRARFERLLERYGGRRDTDFVIPMMLLRDAFEPLFYDALDIKRPPADDSGDDVRSTAARKCAERADVRGVAGALLAFRVRRLLQELAALPVSMPFVTPPRPVHRRTWRWVLRETDALLRSLDLEHAYGRQAEQLNWRRHAERVTHRGDRGGGARRA